MLVIENLTKTYPNGVRALDGVSLTIDRGMYGLLGPNGAGKSSLMRTLATLQDPDSGTITLDEIDVLNEKHRLRQVLGYLPQEFGSYPRISAQKMLDHFATLKGIVDRGERKDTVEALLHQVNLWKDRKKAVNTYSGGMKQRFGIAQALLGNPRLVIVDEPTAGLDPAERRRFHNLLAGIGENTIVILSTHIVEDVADLCTQMAMLGNGRILLQGQPQDVIHTLRGKVWKKMIDREHLARYNSEHQVLFSQLAGGGVHIHVLADDRPGADFEAIEAGLEDVYFSTLQAHRIQAAV
ncbi:ABC transporter ATP-binding protein [Gilvimarinus sp. F26214L]|uniref:ABC transporter ATP-binding protein n=1 Tax=Gilvimarinus sp. DZF01 TaxID=3461371 RepID=UPI00404603D5